MFVSEFVCMFICYFFALIGLMELMELSDICFKIVYKLLFILKSKRFL